MGRDRPLDEPPQPAARDAAQAALDRPVTAVSVIPDGVNALYRLELADGDRAVLKAPRYATDEAFLVEPLVLSRIREETAVPVPRVLASATAADGPLDRAWYVMDHLEGRVEPSILDLPRATHEQLVREAGAHLAAVHDVRVDLGWGDVHGVDGDLFVADPAGSWANAFTELVDDAVTALHGEGALADADSRFEDLAPAIEDALIDSESPVAGTSPPRALLFGDYRPANLLLAPSDDADSVVRGVVDVGGFVGEGLLDVAMAEDALIDTPLGGTDRAASLRDAFRTAYATHRGVARRELFDARYPYYRLYARADRLSALDYLAQFAREADADAVARRWRSFVDERLAAIRGDP